jgi:hypothetical protein
MRRTCGIALTMLLGLCGGHLSAGQQEEGTPETLPAPGLAAASSVAPELLPFPAVAAPAVPHTRTLPPPEDCSRTSTAPCCCSTSFHDCLSRIYGSDELLLWWFSSGPISTPLVTAAPFNSRARMPGALGNRDTGVILGGEFVNSHAHVGGRTTIGYWFDDERSFAIEGNYFDVMTRGTTAGVASPGTATSPFLTVPFLVGSVPPLDVLASPGVSAGSATRTLDNRLQGAEANAVYKLYDCGDYDVRDPDGFRVELLAGFRWLDFHESLGFATATANLRTGGFANTSDEFSARDNFYGGQLGLRFHYQWDKWDLVATGKCALGTISNALNVGGGTFSNLANGVVIGTPRTTAGGIFAEPSNSGGHSHDVFAAVPEVIVEVGYLLTPRIRLSVGYDYLYCSALARPGNQIDPVINITQNPVLSTGTLIGPARPTVHFRDKDFQAQGVNFGLEIRF